MKVVNRYTLIILLSLSNCSREEINRHEWISHDLTRLTFIDTELSITTFWDEKKFNYNVSRGFFSLAGPKDTAKFEYSQYKDSLYLRLMGQGDSAKNQEPVFLYLDGKSFVRLSSWNYLKQWDSIRIEKHYWVLKTRASLAERIILKPTNELMIQTALIDRWKLKTMQCRVKDPIWQGLRIELSRLSPRTFFLYQGPEEDALLYNTIIVSSGAQKDTFSGYDFPRSYPYFYYFSQQSEEVIECE